MVCQVQANINFDQKEYSFNDDLSLNSKKELDV